MIRLLGFLLVLFGIAFGVYVGIWVMLVGGILDIVDSIALMIAAKPFESLRVAVGVLKIMLSGLAGWLTFLVIFFVAQPMIYRK